MHPYLSQPDLIAFCQKNNVHGRFFFLHEGTTENINLNT